MTVHGLSLKSLPPIPSLLIARRVTRPSLSRPSPVRLYARSRARWNTLNVTSDVQWIHVPSLPLWSPIEVRNNNGVSAYDVLARLRDVLNRSVSPIDMNAMVGISTVASEYFGARTHADPREFAQGVERIDFLGPNVFFAGLSRSRDGRDRWEVHFVPRA
ncbi:hypothetical protein HD554DRAFT_2313172 [Boletus coccyginus]|nr:hypothetical protein HD554DRAFT_2313172 [Boletus coccyginus]